MTRFSLDLLPVFSLKTFDSDQITGIVLCFSDFDTEKMKRAAIRLQFASTGFACKLSDKPEWSLKTFSANGELSHCVQSILGLAAILSEQGFDAPLLRTPNEITVRGKKIAEKRYFFFVEISVPAAKEVPIDLALISDQGAFASQALIEGAKPQVFIGLSQGYALEDFSLPIEAVLHLCALYSVRAVYCFSDLESGTVRLRRVSATASDEHTYNLFHEIGGVYSALEAVSGFSAPTLTIDYVQYNAPSKRFVLHKREGKLEIGGNVSLVAQERMTFD